MGNIWAFNYMTGEALTSIKAHNDRITMLRLSNSDEIISCSKESFINVYALTGSNLTKLQSIK